jgi:WD40 repeat protein
MAEAADALAEVYATTVGRAFPRSKPTSGRQTAATLNNRAVSLLDLGRGDPDALWSQALGVEPQHLESTYNQALFGWVHGRVADADLFARIDEAQRAASAAGRGLHLRGSLLLGAGEYRRAIESLSAAAKAAPSAELQRDRALAACAVAPGTGQAAWREVEALVEDAVTGSGEQPWDVVVRARARAALRAADAGEQYAEGARRHHELPADLPEAAARFLPGHERRAVLKDLTETALAVAVTPDGAHVVAATEAGALRAWGTASGQAEGELSVPELRIKCVAAGADGRTVLVGGEGAAPHWCDLASGRPQRALQRHPGITTALAVSGDGARVAGGSSDRAVRVWDAASGKCLHTFEGHAEGVSGIAISDDGAVVASGGLDGSVRVWDVAAGRARAVHEGHRGKVTAVALDAARGVLVSAGEDRTVRLWPLSEGPPGRVLAGPTSAITALALSSDAQSCAATSLDRTLRLWDLAAGRLRTLVRLEAPIVAAAAAPGASSMWCSTGTTLQAVRLDTVWRRPNYALARPVSVVDVQQRDAAFRQRVSDARASLTRGDRMTALNLAREARFVTGHERSPEALALWDDVTAQLPRKGLEAAWEMAVLEGHRDPIVSVAVSADGGRAVSGDLGGQVRVWDLAARGPSTALDGHEATVSSVALTPDQKWAVSGSWDRTLRLWPLAGGDPRMLSGHGDYVNGVAVSPDGRRLPAPAPTRRSACGTCPAGGPATCSRATTRR